MDLFSAIILGLTQGITEFLPISSSGHLVLVREVLEITEVHALAIDSVFHLATTLAVTLYFWRDVWVLVQVFLRKLSRLPVNERDLTLLKALAIGTVPGVILGLLIEDTMLQFESAAVVATVLFLSAIFFMYAEWRYFTLPQRKVLTVKTGLLIGVFQALALIPGFSRTGATLAGGMLLGLSRLESARFSFLLAIPITFGVGVKKLLELITTEGAIAWPPIIVAALVSFSVALIVIHFFLMFIRRYTLWPFIWYSVILSCLVGYVSVLV
jgi:undecaprenyl-diphosphatase